MDGTMTLASVMERKHWLTIVVSAVATILIGVPLLLRYFEEEGRRSFEAADTATFRMAVLDFRMNCALLDEFIHSRERVDESFHSEWSELLVRNDHKIVQSFYDEPSQTCIVMIEPRGSGVRQLSVVVSSSNGKFDSICVAVLYRPLSHPQVVTILAAKPGIDEILFRDVENLEQAFELSDGLVRRAAKNELDGNDFTHFMKLPRNGQITVDK